MTARLNILRQDYNFAKDRVIWRGLKNEMAFYTQDIVRPGTRSKNRLPTQFRQEKKIISVAADMWALIQGQTK